MADWDGGPLEKPMTTCSPAVLFSCSDVCEAAVRLRQNPGLAALPFTPPLFQDAIGTLHRCRYGLAMVLRSGFKFPGQTDYSGHYNDAGGRAGRQRHHRRGSGPGRRGVAVFGLRLLRILPHGVGDRLREDGIRRLHEERRLGGVHPRRTRLLRPHPSGLSVQEAASLICAGITTDK